MAQHGPHAVHQQHRDIGRGAIAKFPRGLPAEYGGVGDNEHGDPQQARRNDPAAKVRGQDSRHRAEQGDQREGPHAGDSRRGVFPLQPDQQAQQQGKAKRLKHRLHNAP
jgi:hypothetical protein